MHYCASILRESSLLSLPLTLQWNRILQQFTRLHTDATFSFIQHRDHGPAVLVASWSNEGTSVAEVWHPQSIIWCREHFCDQVSWTIKHFHPGLIVLFCLVVFAGQCLFCLPMIFLQLSNDCWPKTLQTDDNLSTRTLVWRITFDLAEHRYFPLWWQYAGLCDWMFIVLFQNVRLTASSVREDKLFGLRRLFCLCPSKDRLIMASLACWIRPAGCSCYILCLTDQ